MTDAVSDLTETKRSWGESLKAFTHPRAVAMLFLGFSAGVPILLIFSSLSLWLREAGLSKSAVTMFSWAALGYSFKILLMALTDPLASDNALWWMAFGAVLLGFSSATQDIVIDAYRIESASQDLQAMLSATYIAGYRIGMVVAGAGALFLADYYGSTKDAYSYDAWRLAYLWMCMAMVLGMLTTLVIREPASNGEQRGEYEASDYLRFLLLFALAVAGFILFRLLTSNDGWGTGLSTPLYGALDSLKASGTLRLFGAIAVAGLIGYFGMKGGIANRQMVSESYVDPVREFFRRYGLGLALLLLALVGLYRISDIVLGVISNVFYQDVGFTKTQIASVSKLFGLLMTIAGGFAGGLLAVRYGVMRILLDHRLRCYIR